jgi:Vacuolar protein sorting 55
LLKIYNGLICGYANLIATTALPTVLAHCGAIGYPAMIMSILGGLLIYGTIISFTAFFQEQEEF